MNARSTRLHVRLGAAVAALATLAVAVVAVAFAAQDKSFHQDKGTGPGVATVLEVTGAIGPATSRYVTKALDAARVNDSRIVILQIDTPGGLDTAMRDIIRAILASPVPVVSYVFPPGARAASAGTYILYASHIAAMAPATNLGAATPVSIGGEPTPSPDRGQHDGEPQPDHPSAPENVGARDRASAPADPDAHDRASASEDPSARNHTFAPENAGARDHTSAPRHSGPQDHASAPERAPEPDHSSAPEHVSPPDHASAMERKVVNDAVAYIRGLAELRGRNADWAEQAVRGAASLPASAALKQGVIDLIARDVPDLLSQMDGREVHVGANAIKLATRDLVVENVKPDWRVQLLSVITNPTVAYGLLLIGIYGLLFEGYNPGAVFPGVVGAVSLLIALFAFQILSVNYAGLALVALGAGMIVAELFFPTFGSLGLGGLIAFVVGSLILFDSDVPGMSIGLPLIAGIATVGGLVIVGMAWLASHSLRRPVVTGVQAMIGERAEVVDVSDGKSRIRYGGELWNARSDSTLQAGQLVRITRVDGLTLWVEPV